MKVITGLGMNIRHSGSPVEPAPVGIEPGDYPESSGVKKQTNAFVFSWIPAFAGMTANSVLWINDYVDL